MELYSERMIKGRAEAVKAIVEVDDTDAWVHGHMYWNMFMPCTTAEVRLCDQGSLEAFTGEAET